MRPRLLWALPLLALACSTLFPPPPPTPSLPTATPPRAPTALPTVATPRPTPAPGGPALTRADIRLHPGPELYVGDVVSFEIRAPGPANVWGARTVAVYADDRSGPPLESARFDVGGIGGSRRAELWWVWDTAGREAGPHTVIAEVRAEGQAAPVEVLTFTVPLLPAEARPMPERAARWAQAESACCIFHYLTHTAAERDLAQIQAEAETAFARVEAALGVTRGAEKVTFTLLSRLLGHGGFASSEISLTYIDRNPAGLNLETVFVHEGTHILDRQIARERPTLLTEGVAVYVAGGHYKPEPLDRRAAALLVLDRYIPLTTLAGNFYPQQHEIGYLEAGALVHYLVEAYGWDTFVAMYSDFTAEGDQARMLSAGLKRHYGKGLAEIEAEWLAHLRTLPVDEDQVEDLRLTVALFDTLRRYQQQVDPGAYYLSAWLPDGATARRRGLTADFVRSPRTAEAVTLEVMLTAAEQALGRGAFEEAEALISAVEAVLAADGVFADPLAGQYLQIVSTLSAQGYDVQTISLTASQPRILAIREWPTLEALTLTAGQ